MRKTKIKPLLFITIFLFQSIISIADIDLKKYSKKTYYLKHNIIFLDFKPKIFPGAIIFTEKKIDCSTPMWGFTIARNVEIKIIKMFRNNLFIEVEMGFGKKGNYSILLSSKNTRDFKKSFKEIFTKKKVKDNPSACKLKTTKDLIKCYGHPIYKCLKNGKECWYYNQGFVGSRIDGYHDCWIEIKGSKINGISGHI